MEYKSVNNRCSVIINSLNLPISNEEALKILRKKGFKDIEIDLIELARMCIGKSQYKRGAKISEAPSLLDCSSFMKYLYAQYGIWLPRRSIQQRELGTSVAVENLIAGDLVFVSGHINYFINDELDGVGHVGIVTDSNTVIHAANKESGIIETSIKNFIGENKFRGAKRYIPNDSCITTLVIPSDRDVETSDDLKWIILQSI